jgi:hypothetical protein
MSRTSDSMHTTQQVEDPSSSQRVSTLLNLLKIEKNIIQKLDIMNCKLDDFFLVVAHIEHKFSWTYVEGEGGQKFLLSIFANASDYYTLTGVSDIHSKSQFSMNNKDQWKKLGVATEYFLHESLFKDIDVSLLWRMMNCLIIDSVTRLRELDCMLQQFPKVQIDLHQHTIKKIIDKHLFFEDIPPHQPGQLCAIEVFQRIKV